METIDEEVTEHALAFIDKAHKDRKPFFLWYTPLTPESENPWAR